MPRDIPVGNGQMLVGFDQHYQLRDLYFPHVGQENHAGGGPCRFGVWSPLPSAPNTKNDRRRRRLYWSSQGWDIRLGYKPDTLATDVVLRHGILKIELRCCDVVDFHRPVLVRRVEAINHDKHDREVRLFHHQDFYIYGTKVGDTAYFDPELRCLIHYRANRYLMASWYADGEPRNDEYATGTAGFHGAEGTWRDAEDGRLGNNAIAQGAVDSTVMLQMHLAPGEHRVGYLVIGAGRNHDDMRELHRFLHREGPQGVIDRTKAYWRLWLAATPADVPFADSTAAPPDRVVDLYKRSLLIVRTQIDNDGAIIAANDTDIMQFSRDTYSYLWPRDGALVAAGLDDAGFPDVARSFYRLCARIIDPQGYFVHKYNPDGSPASSWHPWISLGKPQLPIQEDETALVIWALWRHYERYRDIEFVRPLWASLIIRAADFLVRFRDPTTHLPLPSYDLWEERWGVHAFTVATVYGGLRAAQEFAQCFGDQRRAATYRDAANEVRDAFCQRFWSDQHDRFLRRIVPLDHDRTARLMADVIAGRTPQPDAPNDPANSPAPDPLDYEYDPIIDSSMFAIFAMGMLDPHDPRVEKTMNAIEQRLWVKTPVGGVARYEGDSYHRISDDTERVPGNAWFICTLWLADWRIARAASVAELREALPILEWVADHALPSGVLAEQVDPHTNAPLSVSPLTWSHATFVTSFMAYRHKLETMSVCPTCTQPHRAHLAPIPRPNGNGMGNPSVNPATPTATEPQAETTS